MAGGRPIKSLLGQFFGSLTVMEFAGVNKDKRALWKCLCVCGKEKVIRGHSLLRGHIKSCGCKKIKAQKESVTTHGKSKSSEYRAWIAMKNRCLSPKNKFFRIYGAVGVLVCPRWLESFENFFEDMGYKPTVKHSLDRFPNKTGNYEPSNCRWATQKQQMQNVSWNVWIEYDNRKMVLADWIREIGRSEGAIRGRLKKGESFDEIYKRFKKSA